MCVFNWAEHDLDIHIVKSASVDYVNYPVFGLQVLLKMTMCYCFPLTKTLLLCDFYHMASFAFLIYFYLLYL